MKRPRPYADALLVLEQEIARCEASAEYSERSKVEGYVRAKMLLLEKRKEAQG